MWLFTLGRRLSPPTATVNSQNNPMTMLPYSSKGQETGLTRDNQVQDAIPQGTITQQQSLSSLRVGETTTLSKETMLKRTSASTVEALITMPETAKKRRAPMKTMRPSTKNLSLSSSVKTST